MEKIDDKIASTLSSLMFAMALNCYVCQQYLDHVKDCDEVEDNIKTAFVTPIIFMFSLFVASPILYAIHWILLLGVFAVACITNLVCVSYAFNYRDETFACDEFADNILHALNAFSAFVWIVLLATVVNCVLIGVVHVARYDSGVSIT